jgi:hypothetical protein
MTDYESIAVTWRDGVTELRLYTAGGPLVWNPTAHRELGDALIATAADRDTKVVIVTGTGGARSAPGSMGAPSPLTVRGRSPGGRASDSSRACSISMCLSSARSTGRRRFRPRFRSSPTTPT